MKNLLDFLRKYNYFFLFAVLEVVSFVMLFRFNNYQGSVWFTAANSAAAKVDRIYGDIVSYLNLRTTNTKLTSENLQLRRQVTELRDALYYATHDSTLTERHVRNSLNGYDMIPATVISNSNNAHRNNYLVIDRGTADGVRAEMGVVGGGGVVGIVYLTEAHHSLVIPVTNRKSSISCRVRGQRYFGYLEWEGGSRLRAYVDDIPRYAKIQAGQTIETSGYSGIFPPGIFVGRIDQVKNSPDGQSFRLEVRLGTDFANLRDVNVISTQYKAAIDTLRAKAAMNDEKTTE